MLHLGVLQGRCMHVAAVAAASAFHKSWHRMQNEAGQRHSHLSDHDDITVHEGNAGQALALLVRVHDERPPRLKQNLCSRIGLDAFG